MHEGETINTFLEIKDATDFVIRPVHQPKVCSLFAAGRYLQGSQHLCESEQEFAKVPEFQVLAHEATRMQSILRYDQTVDRTRGTLLNCITVVTDTAVSQEQ